MDNIFAVAELVLTIILIIGAVVGWLKAVQGSTERHTILKLEVAGLKKDIGEIKTTIGDGAGMKQDIAQIKLNCAGEMSSMKERVKHLEEEKHE